MKRLIRRVLNKCGFDLIRVGNSHQDLAEHLASVLARRNIDCVFDVGANTGQYGVFLRALGYRGYIISFEPVAAVFKRLKENCADDDKWFCYNYALGDKNEEKIINVYKSTDFSSFLTVNDYAKKVWHTLDEVVPETVKVSRLEDVWDELTGKLGCENYMLKLDTQGFDKFVFDGARNCLKHISVLQSELSLIPVYDGMVHIYNALKEFHDFNYFISGMYPINRDESLSVIEYDCVLVKREADFIGIQPG